MSETGRERLPFSTGPPPLPPRNTTLHQLANVDQPPPYNALDDTPDSPYLGPYAAHSGMMRSQDPRSASTQSLVPDNEANNDIRRKLLIVFIHGFMGDETSFQSFPAHVHNLLAITLQESHKIHTKIYPKYRSRQRIDVATENFSKWLAPHESDTTDVVLLGHSMGGLVCAEVVLLPPYSPATGHPFRHRILGTINFDTPFLGMHPGVISSGLASIFKSGGDSPRPQSPNLNSPSTNTLGTVHSKEYFSSPNESLEGAVSPPVKRDTLYSHPVDPNFNPSFANDINLPIRKGWQSTLHFVNKHSDHLVRASRQYVQSHIEFGGAMADYPALKKRYKRIRALENEDPNVRKTACGGTRSPPRVRFLNYYTASTGKPKTSQSPIPGSRSPSQAKQLGSEMQNLSVASLSADGSLVSTRSHTPAHSPRISLEEHRDGAVIHKDPEEPLSATSLTTDNTAPFSIRSTRKDGFETTNPELEQDRTSESYEAEEPGASKVNSSIPKLTSIPPVPREPPVLDTSQYPDKETRKAAEKEHSIQLKAYKKAVKTRDTVVNEHRKLQEKLAKTAKKERSRQAKLAAEKETEENTTTIISGSRPDGTLAPGTGVLPPGTGVLPPGTGTLDGPQRPQTPGENATRLGTNDNISDSNSDVDTSLSPNSSHRQTVVEKKKRDKKFCVLPPKGANGIRDSMWVRVYMEGVDEVGAHCGLFFMSDTYQMLVGDVAARIEEWVNEDMSCRTIERTVQGRGEKDSSNYGL